MTQSWIVVRRSDSAAVLETWSRLVVAAIDRRTYVAVPAARYLAVFNERVRAAGGVQPAPMPWARPS
jgi:hypothetical protein